MDFKSSILQVILIGIIASIASRLITKRRESMKKEVKVTTSSRFVNLPPSMDSKVFRIQLFIVIILIPATFFIESVTKNKTILDMLNVVIVVAVVSSTLTLAILLLKKIRNDRKQK